MPNVTCPECGASQDPEEGDLSLSCGSILALEFSGVPCTTRLREQSDKCRVVMLQRQRNEWRSFVDRVLIHH